MPQILAAAATSQEKKNPLLVCSHASTPALPAATPHPPTLPNPSLNCPMLPEWTDLAAAAKSTRRATTASTLHPKRGLAAAWSPSARDLCLSHYRRRRSTTTCGKDRVVLGHRKSAIRTCGKGIGSARFIPRSRRLAWRSAFEGLIFLRVCP